MSSDCDRIGLKFSGVSCLKDKYDADYAFTDDTYKMLRFEVDGDGRFAGFALVDGYDTKGKLELTPKNFFSVTFSLTSQTLVNDFMVMPRPKVNDLLKRADDFAQAGNPEGFKNFLARNKNGVVRLLQAGKDKAGDAERAGDKYWKPDCDNMAAIINECRQLLASHATKNTVLGNQAKTHMATFDAVAREVQNQGELSDEQALDLAARFFTAAARVYTLAAMDEAAA